MTNANYVLLLGAGFSRNWGGWLALEAFEYLLGCSEVDRALLLRHKEKGGFESALAQLQNEHLKSGSTKPDPRLTKFQYALKQMFRDMDKAFARPDFHFEFKQKYNETLVARFLAGC